MFDGHISKIVLRDDSKKATHFKKLSIYVTYQYFVDVMIPMTDWVETKFTIIVTRVYRVVSNEIFELSTEVGDQWKYCFRFQDRSHSLK